MTEAGKNVNGVANLLALVVLIAATIIGVVAIYQQDWLWWQSGLAVCVIGFFWSCLLALVAHSLTD